MDTLNQPSSNQSVNQSGTEQPPTINPKPSLHGKALLITFAFCILLFVSLTALLLGSRTKPTSQPPLLTISPTPSHPSPTIDLSRESTGSAIGLAPNGVGANWKTYTNPIYNYTVKYPPNYTVDDEFPIYVTIEIPKNPKEPHGEVIALIRAKIEEYYPEQNIPSQSFYDFVIQKLKSECSAYGPNGSSHCDEVIKNVSITNSNGTKGFEIYLRQVNNKWGVGTIDYQTNGPLFAFDITPRNSQKTMALVFDASYGFPDKSEEKILRLVIDSLRLKDRN